MGLAVGMLLPVVCIAALLALWLLQTAHRFWHDPKRKIVALLLLILAAFSTIVAIYLGMMVWGCLSYHF